MKEVTLTVPQRKVLADMLVINHWNDCLWKEAKKKYDGVRNSRRIDLVLESSGSAKKLLLGLDSIRKRIEALEDQQSEMTDQLERLGFSLDSDGDLSVKTSSSLHKEIESTLDKEFGTFEQAVNLPFERARVKLWTVATPEEAERLIEPFLRFEVKSSK